MILFVSFLPVLIGAGCIVSIDVPDNATVVMDKPRIIVHKERE